MTVGIACVTSFGKQHGKQHMGPRLTWAIKVDRDRTVSVIKLGSGFRVRSGSKLGFRRGFGLAFRRYLLGNNFHSVGTFHCRLITDRYPRRHVMVGLDIVYVRPFWNSAHSPFLECTSPLRPCKPVTCPAQQGMRTDIIYIIYSLS